MGEISKLREAVETAASDWPSFGSGDSNLVDIYWLAQKTRKVLGVTLPSELPPKDVGVRAFEGLSVALEQKLQLRVSCIFTNQTATERKPLL